MAKHIPLGLLGFGLLAGEGLFSGLLVLVEHYCVHAEQGSFVFGVGEEALAFDGGGHDVGHFGALLWQVGCKVHLLPTISLFDGNAREPELRANRITLHEVNCAVYIIGGLTLGFRVDGLWVCFLGILGEVVR